ncbi:general transcription factor 3C polypeptide 3 [Schistocerca piceifrons]|uniref:general transcription factor 3C polypeptide 3 n=1 Tax=Schistocerca piceifrons TaxID=274613 RepID=UPI001F5E89B5|nr:general transcription factor 3C polypeptide 3 [Schistocerca piceifrons]
MDAKEDTSSGSVNAQHDASDSGITTIIAVENLSEALNNAEIIESLSFWDEGSSPPPSNLVPMVTMDESSSSSNDMEPMELDVLERDLLVDAKESELTNRFLNGELTFSQYASLMGGDEDDDGDDDDVIDSYSTVQDRPDESIQPKPSSAAVKEFEELAAGPSQRQRKSTTEKTKRVRRHLPPALKGLMGEANLRYARGDHEMAIKMCLEIIRQVPTAPEPFHTLAVLYEEKGYPEKSLQFALIAAHLNPNDVDQWVRLAEISEEQGNLRQAATCYSKAIAADSANTEEHMVSIYMKRWELLDKVGETKAGLRGLIRLMTLLRHDQGLVLFHIAKIVATKYHERNELVRAKEVMDIAFSKSPQSVTTEDVNLMLELLLSLQHYQECINILVQYCGVEVEAISENQASGREPVLKIMSCNIPETLVIDLKVKVIVVLIHMKTFHLIDELLNLLLNGQSPEQSGDLYLDVAEALMSEGEHREALRLLEPLTETENYSLPAVWLRHAECLKQCGRTEEAIAAYRQVVTQAPQHLDARLTLSDLLKAVGREEEALVVLTQDEESEVLEPGLLYERCLLLKDAEGKTEEFLAVGQLLLSRHWTRIRNREEMYALTRMRRFTKKRDALREIRTSRGEPSHDPDAPDFHSGKGEPSVQEEWALFKEMCNTCMRLERFNLLQRLTFSALGSKKLTSKPEMLRELEFMCMLACFYNADAYYGYNLARDNVLRDSSKPRIWNLFNLVIQRADDVRHNRFLMRLLARQPNHEALTLLHANNCLVAGTYKYALSEYTTAYRARPSAMTAFLVGVTLIQVACQKFSAKKHALVVQGLSFMSLYRKYRGQEGFQEVSYNLGRAFHQLGLLPAAIFNYRNALESNVSPLIEQSPKRLNLQREAAFNLYLIYHSSGSSDIARSYLEKYIVV